jgi:hypothetical protein
VGTQQLLAAANSFSFLGKTVLLSQMDTDGKMGVETQTGIDDEEGR